MIAVAGAVLTGGASRRMGRDKAFLEIEGIPMVRRVADALVAGGCDPVLAVGGTTSRLARIGLTAVDDRWPGEGPLGGIITALEHTAAPTFVVPCDMPWLDGATVRAMVDKAASAGSEFDVVMASTGRPEPLCAIWSMSALGHLCEAFELEERAVHRVIDGLRVITHDVEPATMRNINSRRDLPT